MRQAAAGFEGGGRRQEPRTRENKETDSPPTSRGPQPHPHLGGGPGGPVSDPQAGDRFVLFQATHFVVICYSSDRKLNIYQD